MAVPTMPTARHATTRPEMSFLIMTFPSDVTALLTAEAYEGTLG